MIWNDRLLRLIPTIAPGQDRGAAAMLPAAW
jgi:hypothetical protein